MNASPTKSTAAQVPPESQETEFRPRPWGSIENVLQVPLPAAYKKAFPAASTAMHAVDDQHDTDLRLEVPSIDVDGLMKYVKGPDFPTAGTILGREGIRYTMEEYCERRTVVAWRG